MAKVENCDTIIFSGGKIGFQVELKLEDLQKVINLSTEDIICIK